MELYPYVYLDAGAHLVYIVSVGAAFFLTKALPGGSQRRAGGSLKGSTWNSSWIPDLIWSRSNGSGKKKADTTSSNIADRRNGFNHGSWL